MLAADVRIERFFGMEGKVSEDVWWLWKERLSSMAELNGCSFDTQQMAKKAAHIMGDIHQAAIFAAYIVQIGVPQHTATLAVGDVHIGLGRFEYATTRL